GDYRVFIDLASAATNNKPRVPSNDISVRWDLTPSEITDLLQRASSGHRTGARNAPLKLLRVYLGQIAPSLSKLDTAPLSPEARTIWEQLTFAASLKPLATKPGRVDLAIAVSANGRTPFANETLRNIAALDAKLPLAQRLEKIVNVRRHLGWELAVTLEPAPDARIDRLFAVAKEVEPLQDQFATAPRIVLAPISTNTPPSVTLRANPSAVAVTLRCDKGKVAISSNGQTFQALTNVTALETWLTAHAAALSSPSVEILATPETLWSQLTPWLEPFRHRNWSPDLCAQSAR
ncbi:MAG TPA: hypothetical protein VK968_02620, partial [Roseimicrobium sp.]|nr:hypothetical protein [Roseimicrobium sp.]